MDPLLKGLLLGAGAVGLVVFLTRPKTAEAAKTTPTPQPQPTPPFPIPIPPLPGPGPQTGPGAFAREGDTVAVPLQQDSPLTPLVAQAAAATGALPPGASVTEVLIVVTRQTPLTLGGNAVGYGSTAGQGSIGQIPTPDFPRSAVRSVLRNGQEVVSGRLRPSWAWS